MDLATQYTCLTHLYEEKRKLLVERTDQLDTANRENYYLRKRVGEVTRLWNELKAEREEEAKVITDLETRIEITVRAMLKDSSMEIKHRDKQIISRDKQIGKLQSELSATKKELVSMEKDNLAMKKSVRETYLVIRQQNLELKGLDQCKKEILELKADVKKAFETVMMESGRIEVLAVAHSKKALKVINAMATDIQGLDTGSMKAMYDLTSAKSQNVFFHILVERFSGILSEIEALFDLAGNAPAFGIEALLVTMKALDKDLLSQVDKFYEKHEPFVTKRANRYTKDALDPIGKRLEKLDVQLKNERPHKTIVLRE